MSYFSAENIKSEWDDFHLDVSICCEKGSMTAILGPSGSGKSSLLRILSGLEECKSGKIILDGQDITKLNPGKRNIGMVFQNHALFSHLNVVDNVAYGLRCKGMRKKDSRKAAAEFLKVFNLDGFEFRNVETLSGGESQRVSLARTLIVEPRLVLFDEPLSALDAPLRKKLAGEILRLQKEIGFTGIMVTHDIEEAKTISEKILLMSDGKIVWRGKSQDFTENLMEKMSENTFAK